MLMTIFESWTKQLQWGAKHEGEYCLSRDKNAKYFFKTDEENIGRRTYEPSIQGAKKVPGLPFDFEIQSMPGNHCIFIQ
jgi:hypothetical protein